MINIVFVLINMFKKYKIINYIIRLMDENEEKVKFLMDAFNDVGFQKTLENYKKEIENLVKEFTKYAKEDLKDTQKLLDIPEIRIKDEDSFKDKIIRNNYVNEWPISQDKNKNIDVIKKYLDDLIQVRINCYFFDDETDVYDLLKKYQPSNIEFKTKSKPKKLKNNLLTNYKIEGIYKSDVSVEFQIKSLIDNLWSEVEHEIGYKRKKYDSFDDTKLQITKKTLELFLTADSQLNLLYNNKIGIDEIIYSLFCRYSYDEVRSETMQEVLGQCYDFFFFVMKNDEYTLDTIKEYVSSKIISKVFNKKKLNLIDNNSIDIFKEKYKDKVTKVRFEHLTAIGRILYDFNKDDDLVDYFSYVAINKLTLPDDEQDENGDLVDSDASDKQTSDVDAIIMFICTQLGEKKNEENDPEV